MLNQFAKPGAIVAVVSDSYDIYYAASHLWGEKLRNKVIESGATVVIRPDSGEDIPSIVNFLLHKLDSKFGHTINTKGYKVLNYVRLIQGDGINRHSINDIMNKVVENGWSMDNLNFGMGGQLLQGLNRDTLKFAYKASAAKVNGKWIDVYKDPVTDKCKRSKKGKVELYYCKSTCEYTTQSPSHVKTYEPVMETVFENGKLKRDMTFNKVRENSEK